MFEEFSSNLALHEPHNKGYFKCPICLELFDSEYLISRPNKNAISIAHIMPKSFINAGYTLSCIKCDGKLSILASSERLLRHNLRLSKWQHKPYLTRTQFKTPDGLIKVFTEIDWDKNGEPVPNFRLSDFPNISYSEEIKYQYSSYVSRDESGKPDDFSLWRSYLYERKVNYANLNWWHSFYLFMFHHFGYQWVLNDSRGELIRQQLLNLDKKIIPDVFLEPRVLPMIAPHEEPPHNHLPIRPSLRFGIDKHNQIINDGFYVVFPKLNEKMNHVTLFLPWDFSNCVSNPTPCKFTSRLRYGHSVIKHRIPDHISPKDVLNYQIDVLTNAF
jgi:hypothetical protein